MLEAVVFLVGMPLMGIVLEKLEQARCQWILGVIAVLLIWGMQ